MTTLYHPICHLVNDERLYYLQVDASTNVFKAKTYVVERLQDMGLSGSCCGYITFGSSDILLRVWATDRGIGELIRNLREDRASIQDVRTYMVIDTDTWYQNILETGDKFWDQFHRNSYERIMHCDFRFLQHKEDKKKIKKGIKFFSFLKIPYATYSTLFPRMVEFKRTSKNIAKYFKNLEHISLYSYQTETHQGVILKAKADALQSVSRCIDALTDEFNVRTTTCICSQEIVKEMDNVRAAENGHLSITIRKKTAIYNLLKSHDCYKGRFQKIEHSEEIDDRFREVLRPLAGEIFFYTPLWWNVIDKIRKLFRWTVFQKNDTLKAFLIEQYVTLEKALRDDIGDYVLLKHQDVDRNTLTFGNIPRYMGELKEYGKLTKTENQAMTLFGKAIKACGENRNDLIHANVMDLFQEDADGKGLWETFVFNLSRLLLLMEQSKSIYHKFLANLKTARQRMQC